MVSNILLYIIGVSIVYGGILHVVMKKYFGFSNILLLLTYVAILINTRITPIYIDYSFGYYLVFLLSITGYLFLCIIYYRKYSIIYGLLYYFHFFILGLAPYIFLDCPLTTYLCIYTRLSKHLISILVFITGFILMFFLNTITYVLKERLYRLHIFISTLYLSSIYSSLLENLFSSITISFIVFFTSIASLYIGIETGKYLFFELSIEKIFDKYVSINALLIFIFISLISIYVFLW